jgi:hypothetical protein
VDTGRDGDANPEMVLADLVPRAPHLEDSTPATKPQHAGDHQPPVYKPVDIEALNGGQERLLH